MIKLDLTGRDRQNEWVTIRKGVEFLLKPYDAADAYIAQAQAQVDRINLLRDLRDCADDEERINLFVEQTTQFGRQEFDTVVHIAKLVVLDWRGIGYHDREEAVPFNQLHLELALKVTPNLAAEFSVAYNRRNRAVDQEKKDSAAGRHGTATKGNGTASDVASETTSAPAQGRGRAASAPT